MGNERFFGLGEDKQRVAKWEGGQTLDVRWIDPITSVVNVPDSPAEELGTSQAAQPNSEPSAAIPPAQAPEQ